MTECPCCGKRFNWWQRAIGEHREHLKICCQARAKKDEVTMSTGCRGCPAACFEGGGHKDKRLIK